MFSGNNTEPISGMEILPLTGKGGELSLIWKSQSYSIENPCRQNGVFPLLPSSLKPAASSHHAALRTSWSKTDLDWKNRFGRGNLPGPSWTRQLWSTSILPIPFTRGNFHFDVGIMDGVVPLNRFRMEIILSAIKAVCTFVVDLLLTKIVRSVKRCINTYTWRCVITETDSFYLADYLFWRELKEASGPIVVATVVQRENQRKRPSQFGSETLSPIGVRFISASGTWNFHPMAPSFLSKYPKMLNLHRHSPHGHTLW